MTECEESCIKSAPKVSFSQKRGQLRTESRQGTSCVRTSRQICKPGECEEKLEALLDIHRKTEVKSRILKGLLYVLRQLLVSSPMNENKVIGYLPFQDAYGFYCGFFDGQPTEEEFRDHLLHPDHGLCVTITSVVGRRFVILNNDSVDLTALFIEIQELEGTNDDSESRFPLSLESVQKIIASMDTEYDKSVLKAVLFASSTRNYVYKLGMKPDRCVHFLSKVIDVSNEYENANVAAGDIFTLRVKNKFDKVVDQLQNIDSKIEKCNTLSDKRKSDLLDEKDSLQIRKKELACFLNPQNKKTKRKMSQTRKRIAINLLEENRIKRRKLGAGAPQLLDSEDEMFIAKAVEDKSTAHGRRHDITLYSNHRVKKRHFLSLANYSLIKRGKRMIKSATTVLNRGRPRYVRSKQARVHIGKSLFCAKKPPKTELHASESTHYQRAHVKSVKRMMFSDSFQGNSLVISMDDKAYLRPGTDVGARDVKTGVIYDVANQEKQKKLPQHDFSTPEVHITPASFRFMTGKTVIVEESKEVICDQDQTVVVTRPKYFIGSSGSVWASDYMMLRREVPGLFEPECQHASNQALKTFCAQIHDSLFYFKDTTMKDDVACVTSNQDCVFRDYEHKRLRWLCCQLTQAVERWRENHADDNERLDGLLESVEELIKDAECLIEQFRTIDRDSLWSRFTGLVTASNAVLQRLKFVQSPCYGNILKATDAGPGVGITNFEVRFRDAEIVRIHGSDHMTRLHRAPGDSGQNEAERSNAAIGEALVDGSALKWDYHKPSDGLTEDELNRLTVEQTKELEKSCKERNAWQVAKDVQLRIDDEPGPAGDYMKAFVTVKKDDQFFYNAVNLASYVTTHSQSKKLQVPGHAYFQKIESFIQSHFHVGEMYLEYLKGSCQQTLGTLCEYCKESNIDPVMTRVPSPMPDSQRLPEFHYLNVESTPLKNKDGSEREIDDFHPRVQLKRLFASGEISTERNDVITSFANKYIVKEDLVRKYLEHLQYLKTMREKRKAQNLRQTAENLEKSYGDIDWKHFYEAGQLKSLKVGVLNKYILEHNLGNVKKLKKKDKLRLINAHIAQSLVQSVTVTEVRNNTGGSEDTDSDNDSISVDMNSASDDTDSDIILAEVGNSSDIDSSQADKSEDDDPVDDPLVQLQPVLLSRYGRRTTAYWSRNYYGD
ncbi:uncharacterized protein [Ptychodera flava]|uniref:uncharacterized protein n=1 Tax=Ptychodera flava TaxID=63121 RepID=UPI00396A6177